MPHPPIAQTHFLPCPQRCVELGAIGRGGVPASEQLCLNTYVLGVKLVEVQIMCSCNRFWRSAQVKSRVILVSARASRVYAFGSKSSLMPTLFPLTASAVERMKVCRLPKALPSCTGEGTGMGATG